VELPAVAGVVAAAAVVGAAVVGAAVVGGAVVGGTVVGGAVVGGAVVGGAVVGGAVVGCPVPPVPVALMLEAMLLTAELTLPAAPHAASGSTMKTIRPTRPAYFLSICGSSFRAPGKTPSRVRGTGPPAGHPARVNC
jgi:hypothetical protein